MNEAMQWTKFGEWQRSACSRFAYRRYYGAWSDYKPAWLVIRTAKNGFGKAWTIVRLRKHAKAWAEASANGNQWYHNALKTICPECKRVFDMWNSIDVQEWSAGHDCEPAHHPFIDMGAFDPTKE